MAVKVRVKTKPCPSCKRVDEYELDDLSHREWKHGLRFIQDAFPELTPDQREQFITGYCKKCWDDLFPEEEE